MQQAAYPRVDLGAWLGLTDEFAAEVLADMEGLEGVEISGEALLAMTFAQLSVMYDAVDEAIAETTAALGLPCHKGCDACCRNSVFLTPLEFAYAWSWAQDHLDDATRTGAIAKGLALYQKHHALIDAFEAPPPDGADDHYEIAKELHFACPLLDDQGSCMIYPARELLSRLFGTSFNADGGMYGCQLVQAHMEGKEATLLTVQDIAAQLRQLPMTHKRQVYPYYFHQLFGANADTRSTRAEDAP